MSCLLALPIGKRLGICAGFGLGDKNFAHSLVNVGMTSVQRMKIFRWMQIFMFWGWMHQYITKGRAIT